MEINLCPFNKNSTTKALFCVNLIIQIFIYTLRKKHPCFPPRCAITGFFPDSMKQHTILFYTCTPPRENKDRLKNQPLIHPREKTMENQDVGQRAFLCPKELWLCLCLQRFRRTHTSLAGGEDGMGTHSQIRDLSVTFTSHLPHIQETTQPQASNTGLTPVPRRREYISNQRGSKLAKYPSEKSWSFTSSG